MRTWTLRVIPTALALSLALAGCSGDSDADPAAAPSPTPTATSTSVGSGPTFADTDAIRTALEAAGVPCEEPEKGQFGEITDAQRCIVNGSEDAVLLRFGSPQEKAAYLADKDELASVVVGPDWAVQTVLLPTAEQVADALGGEVVPGATA